MRFKKSRKSSMAHYLWIIFSMERPSVGSALARPLKVVNGRFKKKEYMFYQLFVLYSAQVSKDL